MVVDQDLNTLKLVSLVRQLGSVQVAESLGIDEDSLRFLVSGELVMDEDIASNLERLCEVMGDNLELGDPDDLSAVSTLGGVVAGPAEPDGAFSGDGWDPASDDVVGEPVGPVVLPPRGVQTFAEYHEERRKSLWKGRDLAVMTQFHLGLSYAEKLDMFHLVLEIELTLIMTYGDSMPEPGVSWDPERRDAEVQRRLARLRWVDRQRDEFYGGLKGFMMRIMGGRRRLSGKELYQQMVEYADEMLDIAEGVDLPKSLMGQVDSYLDQDRRVLRAPAGF